MAQAIPATFVLYETPSVVILQCPRTQVSLTTCIILTIAHTYRGTEIMNVTNDGNNAGISFKTCLLQFAMNVVKYLHVYLYLVVFSIFYRFNK